MTNDPQTEFLALGVELRGPCSPARWGEIERLRASIFARLSMGERQALLHAERQAAQAEFQKTGQTRGADGQAVATRTVAATEAENARLRQEVEQLKAVVANLKVSQSGAVYTGEEAVEKIREEFKECEKPDERRHWTRTPDGRDHEDHPMETMLPSKPTVEERSE